MFADRVEETGTGPFLGAEGGHVGGELLYVEDGVAAGAEVIDQKGDGGFAGVVAAVEHAFAGEEVAGVYAVEAAHQFGVEPDFDAVGEAAAVGLGVGFHHGGVYPCVASGKGGAGADDFREGMVEGDAEAGVLEVSAGAFAEAEFGQGKDTAFEGADPGNPVMLIAGPGEDAEGIGGGEGVHRHGAGGPEDFRISFKRHIEHGAEKSMIFFRGGHGSTLTTNLNVATQTCKIVGRAYVIFMNTSDFRFDRRRFLGAGSAAAVYALLPARLRAAELRLDTVSVIHTTDLHGNILPTANYEGVPDVGGLARCATRIKQWRAMNPHSMLVDIGDLYQGTPAGYATRGGIMTRCLNHLDYDAWVLGNHEFDWGMETVNQAVADSRMAVLAANSSWDARRVWDRDQRGQLKVLPYIIKELNGYRIAFIGLTTPGMPNWFLPELVKGFAAHDPVPVLKETLAEVRELRPDAVVLGTHMGIRPWSDGDDAANRLFAITRECPGIDAILGGHTHRDQPNQRVNGVVYSQANYFGIHLGRLDLVFDRDTRRLVQVQPLTAYMDAAVAVDPEVVALVRDDLDAAEAHLDNVVGVFEDPLEIRNSPGNPSELERLIGSSIHEGLTRRDIPVDAVLHGLLFADGTVPAGEKSVRDLWKIIPFENFIVTAEVTREQLIAILQEVFSNVRQLRSLMGIRPVISGRGENLKVTDLLNPDGSPLPQRRIRIAVNSYDAASGGGRFPVLRDILAEAESNRTLHRLQSRALLIEYVQRHTPVKAEALML